MGATALVETDLKMSERIVSALESTGIRVSVAMWVALAEYADWRFVLASRDLDKLDQGEAYLKINRAMKDHGITVWQMPTIILMKTTDPFIRAVRKTYRHVPDVAGIRLGGRSWGDRYVDDAYAYRIA